MSGRERKIYTITEKGRQVRKAMWRVYGPLIHAHMRGLADEGDLEEMALVLSSLIRREV